MRDNNIQVGGTKNIQQIVNNRKHNSWQDNVILFVIIGIVIAVAGMFVAKHLGY